MTPLWSRVCGAELVNLETVDDQRSGFIRRFLGVAPTAIGRSSRNGLQTPKSSPFLTGPCINAPDSIHAP